MKNLAKFLIPAILYFSTASSVQNPSCENILREYEERDKKEYYERTIKSFFNKIENITYKKDIDVHGKREYWQTLKETDSLKTGDCGDKAIYTFYNLNERGIEVILNFGKLNKESEVYHLWNEYSIGSENYILETSVKPKIINKDSIDLNKKYKEFLPNDYFKNLINEFEKRSGIELKFKNFQ
jgi:hypothetical protein